MFSLKEINCKALYTETIFMVKASCLNLHREHLCYFLFQGLISVTLLTHSDQYI